jgi:diaminopimelate decarboxylase
MKEIIESVKSALKATVKLPENFTITMDSHLRDDIGIDSLTSMDFLMYLEDHIDGFRVDASTLTPAHFNSVKAIVEYVTSQLPQFDTAKVS